MLHRFFDNSPELLLLDLLGHEATDPAELGRVRELLGWEPRNRSQTKLRRRS
jgi:hypothetical protein